MTCIPFSVNYADWCGCSSPGGAPSPLSPSQAAPCGRGGSSSAISHTICIFGVEPCLVTSSARNGSILPAVIRTCGEALTSWHGRLFNSRLMFRIGNTRFFTAPSAKVLSDERRCSDCLFAARQRAKTSCRFLG